MCGVVAPLSHKYTFILNFKLFSSKISVFFSQFYFEKPSDSFIGRDELTAAGLGQNIGIKVKNGRQ